MDQGAVLRKASNRSERMVIHISRHVACDVLDLNSQHPDWSSVEIAANLDASSAWVRATLSRHGRMVPTFFERRKIVGKMTVRP